MTVPDPTAPTAGDVITRVVVEHYACGVDMTTPRQYTARGGWNVTCTCGDPVGESGDDDIEDRHARHVSAAVVAAIRGMSVQQKAELIGGEVETGNYGVLPHHDKYPFCIPRSCTHREYERHDARVVGPWQPEDPS